MDCLLCYKMFIGEKEFQNYNPNLELCKKALLDLFGISRNPDVQGLSEDLIVCMTCHRKLEDVEELVTQLKEFQRRVDQAKIEIKNEMVKSKKVSEVMAKDLGDCMSKSSLDRLVLLKAIETGTSTLAPLGHDGIDAEHSNDSFEAQVTPAAVEPEIHNSANGEILPIRATKPNELLKTCSKNTQILPGVSTLSQVASSSKSRTLRNQKAASNKKNISDSKPEDGSCSEDDTDVEDNNKEKGLAQIQGGKLPRRARGFALKEYTRLENGSFKCKHCFKILIKKMSLWQHYMTHQPPRFKCQVQGCGKSFIQKSTRNIHVQMVHERRRDFKCEVEGCDKVFGAKRELQKHISRKHKKMAVDKKNNVKIAQVNSPKVTVKELKVQVFECRMTPSCRRMFISENARDVHEESHVNN